MREYTELEWIGRMGEYIEQGCIGKLEIELG